MQIFAGVSVAFLVLVALAIVIKTFVLWHRTRGVPELLLALYLSCATVIGYPLAIAMALLPASEHWLLHVVAEPVMSAGWISLLLFTLKVFRPNAVWARWLVGLTVCLVLATNGAYVVEVSGESPRAPAEMTGLTAMISLPVAIAYFWTTIEAFLYHRRMRRQLRLGLVDAIVVNRVLLWGLMALAAGTALVINIAELMAGSYMDPLVVLVSSVFGVAHASCLFLAFHPPAWYKGWLDRRAPAEAV